MRKKKTTGSTTGNIKAAASKTVKETAAKVVEKVTEEAPGIVDTVSKKAGEIINSPIVEESREAVKEATEKAVAAVRTRITEVNLEIFETSVSLDRIEKAVKKDVADKKLKGEIKIYVNAERRAAYYTVNDEGSEVYRIDLRTL